jgi:ADP-dependent NAD(P)H-hydrate dehydratase / NAD(P)H-hydrate epimerase
MKIFTCKQIREIDEYTIKSEPVSSVDLMERAAVQVCKWYIDRFERSRRIFIFAGPGNNGGDGLAVARILASNRYEAEAFFPEYSGKTSDDWIINRRRLENETTVPFNVISEISQFPVIHSEDIIIDALFGSGITRPVAGLHAEVIKQINSADALVIAIDIPSGLFGEDNSANLGDNIIKADFTLSFQFPKLSFLFPENELYTGEWIILPIGLNTTAIRNIITPYYYLKENDVAPLLKKRKKFDHKGTFGHGLLVAGSSGKMGAAVLAAKAALRTGIGLLTCHIPSGGNLIMQCSIPEAMVKADNSEKCISDIGDTDTFSAVGIGPGMGIGNESQKALHNLLLRCQKPMVIDADALNAIGLNRKWLSLMNENIILTPHPKEFERINGSDDNSYARLHNQIEFSKNHNCTVVLKGAYTSITLPDGKAFFNSTGNPGMATGGSGDVLTGIILSLLAQGYTPANAAMAGVFLHGLAGDIAAEKSGFESLLASDLINDIGNAYNKIRLSE